MKFSAGPLLFRLSCRLSLWQFFLDYPSYCEGFRYGSSPFWLSCWHFPSFPSMDYRGHCENVYKGKISSWFSYNRLGYSSYIECNYSVFHQTIFLNGGADQCRSVGDMQMGLLTIHRLSVYRLYLLGRVRLNRVWTSLLLNFCRKSYSYVVRVTPNWSSYFHLGLCAEPYRLLSNVSFFVDVSFLKRGYSNDWLDNRSYTQDVSGVKR